MSAFDTDTPTPELAPTAEPTATAEASVPRDACVYAYWCVPVSAEDDARVRQQLRRAAWYYGELARIENRGRVLQRAVFAAYTPEERKPYYARIQDAQQRAVKAARGAIAAADSHGPGLFWGTYNAVAEAVETARRTTQRTDDLRTYTPFDVGQIAVQLQHPTQADTMVGGAHTSAQIGDDIYSLGFKVNGFAPREDGAINKGGHKRPARMRELRVRVGSNPDRSPIWARFHILMHRDLPAAPCVGVRIHCRRQGFQYHWSAQFSLRHSTRQPAQGRGTVAVDVGWRQVPGGMRIARWLTADGNDGELILPARIVEREGKSDSLKSIAQLEADANQARLVAWRATLPATCWFVEATTHLHAWEQRGRFYGLFRQWVAARFEGDEEAYELTAAWLKHDRHLTTWETDNRARMRRQVDAVLEGFAVDLGRHFAKIVIEDFGIAQLIMDHAAKAAREAAKAEAQATGEPVKPKARTRTKPEQRIEALRHRNAKAVQVVTPGDFLARIKTYGTKYGAEVVAVDPCYTTLDCAACGFRRIDIVDRTPRDLTCSCCGVTEDQDLTAAKNLLQRASAQAQAETAALLAGFAPTTKRKIDAVRRNRKASKKGPLENGSVSA